jgi:hypothetical protein
VGCAGDPLAGRNLQNRLKPVSVSSIETHVKLGTLNVAMGSKPHVKLGTLNVAMGSKPKAGGWPHFFSSSFDLGALGIKIYKNICKF